MRGRGQLIVISGPSGAGKGTVCNELLQKNDFWISVSATTRSPRNGEVEGESYHFITREKFLEGIASDDFLEYAQVYGNYYGTPKSEVLKVLDGGRDVILEIDIQGALKVKKAYPKGLFIFILPPSMEELKNRITNRGSETPESLITRFTSAHKEISFVSKYDYAVVNDTVSNACQKIQSIIIAERCRVGRMNADFLKEEISNE
ncbi:guanylate kinase [Clostridium sp. CS001]|uniref:guanylate kinase n=1 Tax=Clostridium sp. CS001 TaxID=2880648 RepID=UPI001CF23B9E|nr:guanylate kinase [Clostridium sp. CS001]MCB2288414.1 guanylate kinase [Clostridium sp. CS001]